MLKLGEKNITKLYFGDKAISKAYYGDKLVYQASDGGRFVKSILFDGASYVDTGFKYEPCRIETRIRFEETGTRQLMGFGLASACYWGAGANGTFDYLNNTNALDMSDVTLDYKQNDSQYTLTVFADNQTKISTGTSRPYQNYRIGTTGELSGGKYLYPCKCEVEYNKIIVGGELIQDLRPFVDENEVACFYDMVTGTKFYNQGTGTLGYTEE